MSDPRNASVPDAVKPCDLDTLVSSLGLVSVADILWVVAGVGVGLVVLFGLLLLLLTLDDATDKPKHTTPITMTTNPTGPDTMMRPGPWNSESDG